MSKRMPLIVSSPRMITGRSHWISTTQPSFVHTECSVPTGLRTTRAGRIVAVLVALRAFEHDDRLQPGMAMPRHAGARLDSRGSPPTVRRRRPCSSQWTVDALAEMLERQIAPAAGRARPAKLQISHSRNPLEHLVGRRRPADDRALRPDHGERRRLELGKVALGRVLGEQAFVAAVVGLAHGRLHADLGGDAGEDQLLRRRAASARRRSRSHRRRPCRASR